MRRPLTPAVQSANNFEWGPGDGLTTGAIENRPALEEARKRAREARQVTEIQDDSHKKFDRATLQD